MKSVPQPEHWSKDFVEHLRTVHFALLTVSVGLILLLSSKPYDVQRAQVQLEELLLLKSWWAPNGLDGPSRFTAKQTKMFYAHGENDAEQAPLPLPGMLEAVIEDETGSKHITFLLSQNDWYWCRESKVTRNAMTYYDAQAPREFPNRLRDLPQWWNLLSNRYAIRRVVDILPIGKAMRFPASPTDHGEKLRITTVGSSHGGNPEYHLALSTPCELQNSYLYAHDDNHEKVFVFHIGHVSVLNMDQMSLSERFHDLKPGPFDKTFSNLIRAARGREDLDLGLLQNKISEEAAKGPEVFEAFGLKFPAEQVSDWGIIVLLSVQLYLVLYLKKLSNKLEPDAPGWDAPWIAMDQPGGAQMVVFVTFVVLPFAAALFTIGQFTWRNLLTTVSSLLATTLLCALSWIYRPRLRAPVESTVTLY